MVKINITEGTVTVVDPNASAKDVAEIAEQLWLATQQPAKTCRCQKSASVHSLPPRTS